MLVVTLNDIEFLIVWGHYLHQVADAVIEVYRGISYFLVDMQTPGITVKPLIDMSDGHHFNEVYFENVRVPRSGLLGELNRGWYMATTTLS